jgi:hypothetical protein
MPGRPRSAILERVFTFLVSSSWQSTRWLLVVWGMLNGLGSGLRRKSVEISRKFRVSAPALERRPEL